MMNVSTFTDAQLLAIRDQMVAGSFNANAASQAAWSRSSELGADHAPASYEQVLDGTHLAVKIATHASPDEWVAFVRQGELPAMLPLSPSQLEQVRGGNAVLVVAIVVIAIGIMNELTSKL